jgi:hypothetical protein
MRIFKGLNLLGILFFVAMLGGILNESAARASDYGSFCKSDWTYATYLIGKVSDTGVRSVSPTQGLVIPPIQEPTTQINFRAITFEDDSPEVLFNPSTSILSVKLPHRTLEIGKVEGFTMDELNELPLNTKYAAYCHPITLSQGLQISPQFEIRPQFETRTLRVRLEFFGTPLRGEPALRVWSKAVWISDE